MRKITTHDVEVEVIGDTEVVGVIQTVSGTLLILENSLGAYAVYSSVRAKKPHVHVPIKYINVECNRITLNIDIVNDEKGVKEVLRDLLVCMRLAECYIDTEYRNGEFVWTELRSISSYRLLSFIPFGVPPHASKLNTHNTHGKHIP
ncbi:hypothetical protein AVT98_gp58 [Sulfolobales virus YNP1]|uniref:hypothetical protein n=1 Tax=Sulfolobales virus YNP1 TaxID=1732179 RepID=UPI00070644EB|nr:hypothetical protein AVT98_gp58 [Sulfolobales virus YNP1]ALG97150.1 hypothetical protein [Sulfolobales virus YNP1]